MQIQSIHNPGMYHGLNKKPPFFEGWYYKLVSADESQKIAIIPGVILGKEGHAFIQILDSAQSSTHYFSFPLGDFTSDSSQYDIHIGQNHFNLNRLSVNVQRSEGQLFGEIQLGSLNPWPVSFFSPGVMGWFAWVPRMECYHGVLSFDHHLEGKLTLNGKTMDFSGGRGYMEKDWGKSFPAAWVWFQSNHFNLKSSCITASVAIIPWLGSSFRGFIVGLWLDGRLHRFTTYNGGQIESFEITDNNINWVLRNRNHRLFLNAFRGEGGILRGPTHLDMGKRVLETLNATIHVKLENHKGEVIFDDTGEHAGLEVIGDLPRLIAG